jgi:PAS domain S-box-containing protein
MPPVGRDVEQRLLVLAPTAKDADLTRTLLGRAGVVSVCCRDLHELCTLLEEGAGAVLLPEEALEPGRKSLLETWLRRQPPWSDLPVLVLAQQGAHSVALSEAVDVLGNVTVLERPARVTALVSAVRAALRARQRQYQVRDHLAERARAHQTQELLAAIVASSDDAIVSKTLDGTIVTWNAGAERLYGYTADEAVGRHITLVIPPERHEEERLILQRLRKGLRIDHFETVRVTKDGRKIDVSLTVSPVLDESGNVVGASKTARDITLRKQTEAALREADRRKDEFLAILAHELRNPLAPIRNALQILRLAKPGDPGGRRVAEMMERQVDHLVRLVDDLMEVSRITRGKIDLRKERIEVAALLRSALETSRPLMEAAGHQLSVSMPAESLEVEGDPVRLTQVVANLLNNAAKYTDPGGRIWLSARRDGDAASISVRDNGAGIPPENLPRIFELFMQVARSSERAQGGLGIGLTLVKNLVELHGGSVEARSEGPGKGSEFVVRLPAVAETRRRDVAPAELQPAAALAPDRILVVDDNRDAAESLGMLLELLGAEVQVAHSGPEALRLLNTYQPAVVLMDIGMPGMDGYEVARRIRQRDDLGQVALVALSGWGQEEDRRRSRRAGFDHHLVKPVDPRALEALLTSLASPGDDTPLQHRS